MDQNERDRMRDDKGIGTEVPPRNRSSQSDEDLQREGNLGNERNRNESDRERERRPDRDRDLSDR
jgi:hypothetical protein